MRWPTGRAAGSLVLQAWFLGAVASGCADSHMARRLEGVRTQLDDLAVAGAYRCAPRELALATANLLFARTEIEQGDNLRAEQHLRLAHDNLGAARLLSPADRCAAGSSPVGPPTMAGGADADGDGVSDDADRCPDAPEDADGYLDYDGCPDLDNDQDGVGDHVDACPDEAEDRDGVDDDDGCPDRDNDGDGVDDTIDRCPEQAGSPAEQGCPRVKYPNLEVTARAFRLSEPVMFEGTSATIRSVSFVLLDTVVLALTEHPEVHLEVQGHTDSVGADARNQKLSEARAQAVLQYLVGRGVDSARLTARGYGETRPIESNRTSQGRAINRRIELVRTDGSR